MNYNYLFLCLSIQSFTKKMIRQKAISSFNRIGFKPSKKKKQPNVNKRAIFIRTGMILIGTYFCKLSISQRNRLDYNNDIHAFNVLFNDHLPNGFRRKRKIKKRKLRYSVIISSNQNEPQRMIIINYLFRNANSFGIWFKWLAFEKSGEKNSFCSFFPCVKDYFHFLLQIC